MTAEDSVHPTHVEVKVKKLTGTRQNRREIFQLGLLRRCAHICHDFWQFAGVQ